jgi:hypothetical protein
MLLVYMVSAELTDFVAWWCRAMAKSCWVLSSAITKISVQE